MKPAVSLSLSCLLALAPLCPAQQTTPAAGKGAATSPAPAQAAAPARAPLANTLMDGTEVKLRLGETISSADAKVGQQVPFEVTDDVVVDGVTVLPKGTPAIATVTIAESKKRMGRGGKLDVNIDSTRLVDGQKIQLRASRESKGGGHVGAMTGAIVATSLVFFPAAPLFLLMHGKDITIPKGTDVTAFVEGDTKLDLARMVPPPAPGAPALIPASTAAVTTATLQVDSSVPGADIEIDGSFAGNTPSTLTVTPGRHTISVKKKGYTDWTRTMSVSGSAVHLNADLDTTR